MAELVVYLAGEFLAETAISYFAIGKEAMFLRAAIRAGSFVLTTKAAQSMGLIGGSSANELKGQTINVRSSTAPRQLIYGQSLVGGVMFYAATTGTNNEYLHTVFGLADHQIQSVEKVYFGDEDVGTVSGNVSSGRYSGKARIQNKTTGGTAYSDLVTETASLTNKWTSSHKLTGISCREGSFPNGLNILGGVPRRYQQGLFGCNSDGERFLPIHSTEWYNCHLLEFPLVMHEPLGREGTVQNTPSFAKTILRLEFYIDCLLKPHRGLDDMYDQTTMVPPLWYCGEYDYITANGKSYSTGVTAAGNVLPYGPLNFGNTTVATANTSLSVPCCYIEDSVMHFGAYADSREQIVQSTRSNNKVTNPNFTMSPSASSWNVNDGGLMIVCHFLQNQVWSISPLRTSILSSRG